MEFNRREFLLGHLQGELGICKKYQLSLFLFCQKFGFYPFKFFEFLAFRVFRVLKKLTAKFGITKSANPIKFLTN